MWRPGHVDARRIKSAPDQDDLPVVGDPFLYGAAYEPMKETLDAPGADNRLDDS